MESPSKVFADIGSDIVAGLNQGVMKTPMNQVPIPGIANGPSSSGTGNSFDFTFVNPQSNDPAFDVQRGLIYSGVNVIS
jgi:hypothetical protein